MPKSKLTDDELLAFQYKLEALKKNLSDSSQNTIDSMMSDDERGGDSLDRSVAEQTKSTKLRLKDRELRRLFDIDAALERLKNHTFGICEVCDDAIEMDRLEANPTARYCLDCQEEADEERRRKRFKPGLLDDPERF